MKYLLSMAVGPVQDFIAAARRCRDLWYGSRLLSDVSKAAARSLTEDGAELIFPAPGSVTVANKLLAVVETDEIREVADRASQAARAQLTQAADILPISKLDINEERFNRQLETILEVYAAWTPYLEYGESRERVELLAAGRKALRSFAGYQGDAGVAKSSLDGIRENVIEANHGNVHVRENECLDAIGVVKRFGGGYAGFDSTLDVAAVPYVRGREAHRPAIMRDYAQCLRKHGLQRGTYSLLYRHESRQLFDLSEEDESEIEEIRKKLRDPRPPYYAFLLGDGDRMGKAIGDIHEETEHRQFSSRLSEFAVEAHRLIEKDYDGCAIYCGGDDVMALLPLDQALECAAAVNKKFGEVRKGVTFSAGLVVAHALEPLSEVREWAKRAEHTAKDPSHGNRKALCVSVYPRSGAPESVYGKWDETGKLLGDIIGLYLDGKLSFGLAHEFRDLLERTRRSPELEDVIVSMAKSIAARKDEDQGARELLDQVEDRKGLERLCRAMLVARPFARAKKEAAWTGETE